ncbi:MAG: Flp pilus assembly protein CpaB [Hyphomicrobiales bacterium]|nr:Flp pilus assembly protein CpaB [Hyphomicrobiales bacterium]
MKKAQIAVLGVALLAGAAAFYLMPGQAPAPVIVAAAPPAPAVENDDVLVAAQNLDYGAVLSEQNVKWAPMPKSLAIPGAIRKSADANAIEELKGAVVRFQMMQEDPIRKEKVVKGPSMGLLSSMVTPGKRAVAINIDASGSTSAGGFVLPNDRVDVVQVLRDEEAAKSGQGDAFTTQTIIQNVRVLAIGPNLQSENGRPVVAGTTATLELDARQAEYVILAQRSGQLVLVLRSMTDALQNANVSDNQNDVKVDRSLTIVRAGIPTTLRAK